MPPTCETRTGPPETAATTATPTAARADRMARVWLPRRDALGWLVAGPVLLAGCASPPPPPTVTLHRVATAPAQQPNLYGEALADEVGRAVRVRRNGALVTAQVGMALAVGDEVETFDRAAAVVRFPDGHEATLLPQTRVRIGSLGMDFGQLFVRVYKQVQDAFRVKTQYITAGVEGTEFWVRVVRGEGKAEFGVVEGRIRLSPIVGRWPPLVLNRNDVAIAVRAQPPTRQGDKVAEVDAIVKQVRGPLRPGPSPTPQPQPQPQQQTQPATGSPQPAGQTPGVPGGQTPAAPGGQTPGLIGGPRGGATPSAAGLALTG